MSVLYEGLYFPCRTKSEFVTVIGDALYQAQDKLDDICYALDSPKFGSKGALSLVAGMVRYYMPKDVGENTSTEVVVKYLKKHFSEFKFFDGKVRRTIGSLVEGI